MRAEAIGRIRLRVSPTRVKGWLWQGLLLCCVGAAVWFFAQNATDNLTRKNLHFGLDFLDRIAGFDIPFRLIAWTVTDTYGRALLVSFLNSLLIAFLCVIASTFLGLLLGLLRLSANWLARNVAMGIIELVRNTPQLVQIFFFYLAVLQSLPPARAGYNFNNAVFLNIRGLFLPSPVLGDAFETTALGFLAAIVLGVVVWRLRLRVTGASRFGLGAIALALPFVVLIAGGLAGAVVDVNYPVLRGFNFQGGVQIPSELVALWVGLSVYSSAFIAEIVRGAMEGIAYGQTEASLSLGLSRWQTLRLVVLPQALRIIVPPVTSQYLNVIKSSSLGAGIAYPELFQIFAGTVLNQSGRAIECIAIVMTIFLVINLITSMFMNWYNRAIALKER
ncbi:MAG: ABC transporter permease subunit [Proteobacteria bacterium]|nr:ABC transporter permease subunit [Pseudomonadota bacterium]MBI3497712.1 ABC transporter permease subunit [Pseudomonadota bacterium]